MEDEFAKVAGDNFDCNYIMDNVFRKHQFSDREIVRLFTILDEDRNSSLDENEIIQWASDLGLKWSKEEVSKCTLTKILQVNNKQAREIIEISDFDTNRKLSLFGELVYLYFKYSTQ